MSTVRMSDYLKRDIVRSFSESHKKSKPEMDLDSSRGDEIYNTYIGPKVNQAKDAVQEALGDILDAEEMFGKASELKVQVPITRSSCNWNSDEQKYEIESALIEDYSLNVPLSTERLVPKGHDSGSYSSYSKEITYTFDRYADKQLNYLCEIVEYNSKLGAQRDLAERNVEELLNKFTTLNQALKAWPALEKLVEPEKIAKVHEKQQRKRKQAIQKEMADQVVIDNDLNKTILTASLIGDADDE